jgi:hypothetical protein
VAESIPGSLVLNTTGADVFLGPPYVHMWPGGTSFPLVDGAGNRVGHTMYIRGLVVICHNCEKGGREPDLEAGCNWSRDSTQLGAMQFTVGACYTQVIFTAP